MKEQKLKCPFCKHDKFIRKMTAGVEIYDDGETMRDDIDWEDADCYICDGCNKEVTEEELIK